jgi:hypothetical protein
MAVHRRQRQRSRRHLVLGGEVAQPGLKLAEHGVSAAVAAWFVHAGGGAAGVAVEVGPGPFEQVARDERVGVAVGDEDGQPCEAVGRGG